MTGGPSHPAIYFLSDYGTSDEFVGVVHAVLHRLAPLVPVIDLSHQIPPFDIAAGASMLERCALYLGTGVVLAVVDPGVGTDRRAVAVGVPPSAGDRSDRPTWLVGPDNGLLVALAAAYGGPGPVVSIEVVPAPDPDGHAHRRLAADSVPGGPGPTFDGRDLFAPAAAHLARGGDPAQLGPAVDPATLVLADSERGHLDGELGSPPSGPVALTSVASVDRFGNVQLAMGTPALEALGLRPGGTALVSVAVGPVAPDGPPSRAPAHPVEARRVRAFGDLADGQWGLLVDGTGHVALVRHRSSAAQALVGGDAGAGAGVSAGAQVRLVVTEVGTHQE